MRRVGGERWGPENYLGRLFSVPHAPHAAAAAQQRALHARCLDGRKGGGVATRCGVGGTRPASCVPPRRTQPHAPPLALLFILFAA
jgi:hypothetical protein